MRRLLQLGLLLVCAAFVGACAAPVEAPVEPPRGILFTGYKAPLHTDVESTEIGAREGEASTQFIHDFLITGLSFSCGEAGLEQAAQEGGLESTTHLDYEYHSVLGGIWQQVTIYAYGE